MRLTADHGSFAASGQAIDFGVQVSAILDQGSFALTMQNVDTKVSRVLGFGSFALTGQDTGTVIALREQPDRGSFAVTGQAVSTPIAMREELAHGSFAANGQNLNFQKSMNAEAGSFALDRFHGKQKDKRSNGPRFVCFDGSSDKL